MPDIPPWAWAVGAVGLGGAIYLYKKHEEAKRLQEESSSSSEMSAEPMIAGVENPAEEFPYSIAGLGGGGSGAINGALETQNADRELFSQEQQQQREFQTELGREQKESQESIARAIKESEEQTSRILSTLSQSGSSTIAQGSAGGVPTNNPGGVTTAPPPASAPPSHPAETREDITCPNGCPGHRYHPSGRTECQVKVPGPKNAGHPKGLYCKWP